MATITVRADTNTAVIASVGRIRHADSMPAASRFANERSRHRVGRRLRVTGTHAPPDDVCACPGTNPAT